MYTIRNYIFINKTDKSVFMYTYGIVIIEIYSCNKELYTYKVA